MDDYKLILGDCIETMRGMNDKSHVAIITDPPYGNGTKYNSFDDTPENVRTLVDAFMPDALRVAQRVFITCGVANIYKYPEPDWVLSWFTPAGIGSSRWGFACWQPILAYGKDPYLTASMGRRPDSINLTESSRKTNHPCPKPLGFMKWLVQRTTLDGESILDPFMGSGTTGMACAYLGRPFTGIEKDPIYYEIAKRDIQNASAMMGKATLQIAGGVTMQPLFST